MSYVPSALVPVPAQNSATNVNVSDVMGNKTDTSAGTSVVALEKKTDADVVTATGTVNTINTTTARDDKHFHSAAQVYPTLAAGVTVTKNNTAWVLGNYAVVVPANTIASTFDIHGINFDDITVAAVYELVLYSGADGAEVEIGRTRCTRTGTTAIATESPFMSAIVAANSQIKAKVAASNTGAGSVIISIRYHSYS